MTIMTNAPNSAAWWACGLALGMWMGAMMQVRFGTVRKRVLASLLFLVAIAVSKTLLTKYVFDHLPFPVALSALSCTVTALFLIPILMHQGRLHLIQRSDFFRFSLVCAAVATDLACTNVGLSVLTVAFQQSIKATLPAMTIAFETLITKRRQPARVYLVVMATCLGPLCIAMDKDWGGTDTHLVYGVIMMIVSVVAGALKYVLAHDVIKDYKSHMGVLGFTFWLEILSLALLVPWAVANGEMSALLSEKRGLHEWLLLIGTAAFGGVRIVAQFCFLENTSATSLATSNVAIQVGIIGLGTILFHDAITNAFLIGATITVVTSGTYAWMKSHGRAYNEVSVSDNKPQ